MKRRELLKNIPTEEKITEREEPPQEEKSADIDESEVFRLPETNSKEVEIVEKPKKKKNFNSESLARGRQTALENRQKKKREREELALKEKEMREQLQYKQLQSKYGKIVKKEEPQPEPVKPPEPQPQPVPQRHVEPVEDLRKKMERETSITSNSIQHTIDYDRIISGLAERMERKTLTDKEVHERIKKQAYDEAQKEVGVYKDRYNALQRQDTISALTRRNSVFQRSNDLRSTYSSRFNNNWYRR